MRLPPSTSSKCLAATDAAMSSSRLPHRGRNTGRRGLFSTPCSGHGEEANHSVYMPYRSVSEWNGEFLQRGDYHFSGDFPQQPFRPQPPFRPQLRPRPDDFRRWERALRQPPPSCERFVVLSYNILADYLAKHHRPRLYFHIPSYILDWGWRKRRILIELGLWSPDIMCLQEVDKFEDLEQELKLRGYDGIWKMRTGPPVDGCAIFWRTRRFKLLHEENIEFDKLELRNNVAQFCVLESTSSSPSQSDSSDSFTSYHQLTKPDQVVVCNTHVLYNPNRGDIKIAQVRILLERAHAISMTWNSAPVIVCGDFNCTPKSPLYNFISEQELDLSGLAKNQVSGQHSAYIYAPQWNRPTDQRGLSNSGEQSSVPFGNEAGNINFSMKADDMHALQKDLRDASFTENFPLPQRMMAVPSMPSEAGISSLHNVKENVSKAVLYGGQVENDIHHIPTGNCENVATNDALEETLDDCMVKKIVSSTDKGNINQLLTSTGGIEKDNLQFKKMNSLFEAAKEEECRQKIENRSPGLDESNCSSEASMSSEASISNWHNVESNVSKAVLYGGQVENDIPHISTGNYKNCATDDALVETPDDCIVKNFVSSTDQDTSNQLLTSTCGIEKDNLQFKKMNSLFQAAEEEECRQKIENQSSGLDESNCSLKKCISSSEIDKDEDDSCKYAEMCNPSGADGTQMEIKCENNNGVINSSCSEQIRPPYKYNIDQLKSLEGDAFKKLAEIYIEAPGATANQSQLDNVCTDVSADASACIEPKVNAVEKKPYDPYLWTSDEVTTASGNAECTVAKHHLKLISTYTEVEDYAGTRDVSKEPQVTSYNRQFMGTVDYIWCSEGLQTIGVLDTIPKHVLRQTSGFPTRKWGSDHLALACELAFTKGVQSEDAGN